VLLILIVAFVLFKIPYLSVPLYGDEAWVYGPAVVQLLKNGISLLPSGLHPDLSRGHPMIFHAIAALWLQIFGTSVTAMHVFSLALTCITFILLFALTTKLANQKAALFATLFCMLQLPILEQSGMLLPEMLLSAFTLGAFWAYLQKKYWLYFLFASGAILTKESGIVTILAVVAYHFIEVYFQKKKVKEAFTASLKYLLPLIGWFVFLVGNYHTYGWFFFPEHISYISLEPSILWDKISGYFVFVSIYRGSNFLFFMPPALALFYLIQRKKIASNAAFNYWLLTLFIIGFILFGALNFYSSRYMTPNLFIFAALFSAIIFNWIRAQWFYLAMLFVMIAVQLDHLQIRSNHKLNLGYADNVICHQKAIDFMLLHHLENEKVYAFFLGKEILSHSESGYVPGDREFTHFIDAPSNQAQYYLFTNFDTDDSESAFRDTLQAQEIFYFSQGKAWAKVLKK
jgi:4-amino-4-deoxy-L-arabinose transferase-like glycosyltransferase